MGLKFAPEVRSYVRTLAPEPKKRIRAALRAIREDPRAEELDVKLLRTDGDFRVYRARVGTYRIVYSPQGEHTYVWRIMHRSEDYGWLERLDP